MSWPKQPVGPDNPRWKGDAVGSRAAHERAQRLYPLGQCERCGKQADERHHVDGNPKNNTRDNIMVVCRSCHRQIDRRNTGSHYKEPRPCFVCGRSYYALTKGRCETCDSYYRHYGRDERLTKRRDEIGRE